MELKRNDYDVRSCIDVAFEIDFIQYNTIHTEFEHNNNNNNVQINRPIFFVLKSKTS